MIVCLRRVVNCAVLLLAAGQLAAAGGDKEAKGDGRVKLHVAAKDPYGGKLTFKWEQVEGPDGKILDSAAASFDDKGKKWVSDTYFVPSRPGSYRFQVTVTSDAGLATTKTFVMEAKKSGTE